MTTAAIRRSTRRNDRRTCDHEEETSTITPIMASHSGDSWRASTNSAPDTAAATASIRSSRPDLEALSVNSRIVEVHSKIAELISRLLGFTTPLMKTALGVSEAKRPTRKNRDVPAARASVMADATSAALISALSTRTSSITRDEVPSASGGATSP